MDHTHDELLTVNESDFDQVVLAADRPVLVDFQAAWCAPCRAIAPVIETLAIDYADRLTVATVDVDENPGLAQRYSVRSVPTVMLVADGEVQRVFVGARSPREYRDGIDALVH